MKQLNIFDIEQEEQLEIIYKEIRSKLKHYGINKIYEEQFKGKSTVLWIIKEELEKYENYNNYMSDLISELLKIVPLVEHNFYSKQTGIFKYENGGYGYVTSSYEINGIKYKGCSGPLYCLDMLPKHFFKELIK